MAAAAEFSTLNLSGLDVILALHTTEDPTPEEWQGYLDHLGSAKRKNAGDISKVRSLVISDGGAPNAKQREMSNNMAGGSLKLAGITNMLSNPVKRGIATAIQWTNPSFRAMVPTQWREALKHLNLDGQIQPILREFEMMQRRLPPVSSLAQLAADAKSTVA